MEINSTQHRVFVWPQSLHVMIAQPRQYPDPSQSWSATGNRPARVHLIHFESRGPDQDEGCSIDRWLVRSVVAHGWFRMHFLPTLRLAADQLYDFEEMS